MKTVHWLVLTALVLTAQWAGAQEADTTKEPVYDMGTFVVGTLIRDVRTAPDTSLSHRQLQQRHVANMFRLLGTGEAAAAGPLLDNTGLRGIIILNTDSIETARAIMKSDPLIHLGYYRMEYRRWFAARGILKRADSTGKFSTYYFGILRKGPAWTPASTDSTKKIQEGHMANIRRMAKLGKLLIAGPMIDNEEWRGLFIFKTETAEEARSLAHNDPAIQSGRLILELHPWMIPENILP